LTDGFDNAKFRREFIEFLKWNNVVTVFSRLNPFIPLQKHILKGLGNTTSPGKVVNIDLTKDDSQLWSEYNRRLKSYINKSRREYTVLETQTEAVVRDFIDMYYGNMRRVNAQERYFFKEDYFFDLFKSKDFEAKLLMASKKSTGESMGGALFIKKRKIVQYHLSGARESVLGLNPIKLLIDEMRREASREGFTYFNLGGGVGNQEDSLFRFKSGFSKDFKDFMLWKFVVDENVYNELVQRFKSGVCERISSKCNDFFPCYRCELV
jgi:lipid II:glycine glycyltransferase (peptidoglycan interpeptide bridge formation enzyme)